MTCTGGVFAQSATWPSGPVNDAAGKSEEGGGGPADDQVLEVRWHQAQHFGVLEEVANGDDGGYRPQAPSQDVATKLMGKCPAGLRLGL